MQADVTETPMPVYRLPNFNLRWSGIIAGVVVGIAVNLVLMLLGAAAGLAVFEASDSPTAVPIAVTVWNVLSTALAAFIGGYVAARSAGLRRASDGVLHGLVVWGTTMLLSALLATSATGVAMRSLFATGSSQAAPAESSVGTLSLEDRQEAVRALEGRLGLSADQANHVVDQAIALADREEQAGPAAGRGPVEGSSRRAISVAGIGLAGAILLSLLAAMGGGLVGARGARRLAGAQLRRSVVRANPEPPPDEETSARTQ